METIMAKIDCATYMLLMFPDARRSLTPINVMIELVRLKRLTKSPDSVMNTALGAPENLPFDFQHRRFQSLIILSGRRYGYKEDY
jgi:hypothetical protein